VSKLSLFFNLWIRTGPRTASLTWVFAGQADGLRMILRSAKEFRVIRRPQR
jgi:hypothetical protein